MTKEHPANEQRETGSGTPLAGRVAGAALSRFGRNGRSHREFCSTEDLAPGAVRWWRCKLGGSRSNGATVDAVLLVELAEDRSAAPAWDAELALGGGVVLRVRRPESC